MYPKYVNSRLCAKSLFCVPLSSLSSPSGWLTFFVKIKGSHTAMKTGMLAAEEVHKALTSEEESDKAMEVSSYQTAYENSWVHEELKSVRNYHPSFERGFFAGTVHCNGNFILLILFLGVAYSGVSAYLLRGKEPWTFRNHKTDSEKTKPAKNFKPIEYPTVSGFFSLGSFIAVRPSFCHLTISRSLSPMGKSVSIS